MEDIKGEMVRMAEEIGHLKEENQGLKKRVVLMEDSAWKAEIEALQRVYKQVELRIWIWRAPSEGESLVREIGYDDEYTEAVEWPPVTTLR